jgi:hypothetical protein
MKSKLIFFLFLLLSSTLGAQNIGGGLVAGFNTSQIDGDGIGGFYKAGLNAGGYLYYPFSDAFALQTEILFDQLGSANKGILIARLNYVTVPVLAQVSIPVQMGNVDQQIQIQAGPGFGILLGSKDDFNNSVNGLRKLDLRVQGGVEYRFVPALGVNIRYGYSLLSMFQTDSPLIIDRNGWFNHYISFSLRLRLFGE